MIFQNKFIIFILTIQFEIETQYSENYLKRTLFRINMHYIYTA